MADVETSQRDFVQIPISKFTNAANDEGRPLCLSRGEEAQSDFLCFKKLANSVCSKLFRLQHQRHFEQDNGRNSELLVKFENCEKEFDVRSINLTVDIGSNEQFKVRFYSENGAYEVVISGEDLRSTDPKTGKKLLPAGERQNEIKHSTGIKVDQYFPGDLRSKKRRLFPAKIERKGHYGYSVKWADGVTTIYSMLSLALAGGGRLDT